MKKPSSLPIIDNHALGRWIERFGGSRREMREAWERAMPFGGQQKSQFAGFFLDPETTAVMVCKWSEQLNSYVISTVLTHEMATANMESFVFGAARVPVLMSKVAKGRAKDNIIKERKHKDRDDRREYGGLSILDRRAIESSIAG